MPSNLRSNSQSGPMKRSCVSVAAIGSSQSGIFVAGVMPRSVGLIDGDSSGPARHSQKAE